jgi:hypothetical protein
MTSNHWLGSRKGLNMRTAILSLAIMLCVSCSTPPTGGGAASKEDLANAYIAALQTKDMNALWSLVHPHIITKLNDDGRRFFESVWARRMDLNIDPSAERYFKELDSSADPSLDGSAHVYVPITHTFQLEGKRKDGRDSSALVYANCDGGKWFTASMIPKQ